MASQTGTGAGYGKENGERRDGKRAIQEVKERKGGKEKGESDSFSLI